MKKLIFLLANVIVAFQALSQVESFENVTLDSGKVLNGINGETEYTFEYNLVNLHLPTFWDTSFGGYWASGWALSRKYDSATITTNFARHMYCVKAFKGAWGSHTFAIGQDGASMYRDYGSMEGITSIQITNTTAAYNSMLLGDVIGKKFGGSTGNDSDYFFCRIHSFHQGKVIDSQDVYLADFRFADNSKDYILKTWEYVKFSWSTDSLSFHLYSSDNVQWGMNTPAFFAVDDVSYTVFENTKNIEKYKVKIGPNPSTVSMNITSDLPMNHIVIYDMSGKLVYSSALENDYNLKLDVSEFLNGMYTGRIESNKGAATIRFMVQH